MASLATENADVRHNLALIAQRDKACFATNVCNPAGMKFALFHFFAHPAKILVIPCIKIALHVKLLSRTCHYGAEIYDVV